MEFSRQEYWSGLPFPSPGDLPETQKGHLSTSATSQPEGKAADWNKPGKTAAQDGEISVGKKSIHLNIQPFIQFFIFFPWKKESKHYFWI